MILDTPAWRAAFSRLASESARPRGTAVLWLGLVGLYLMTAGYGSLSADVTGTYLPAWSVTQLHTANLDGFQHLSIWVHQIGDHWRSDRFPGAILLAMPAYAILGSPDGVTVGPSLLTVAVAAATTVALVHRALLRLVAPGLALAGAVVLGVGTSTWSLSADALWTHTATQLGIALMMFGLATRRPWVGAIGAALGAAARPHTAVVAAVLGVGDVVRTRRWTTVLLLGLGAVAGLTVVYAWSGATLDHASILPGTYTGRGGTAGTAGSGHTYGWPLNVAGFLFSPERGVIVLCPFVVPCLFGVRRAWRTAPGWVRDSAIASVVYSLVQLSANGFAGGWGFYGFRLAIEGITLATPLLVLSAREVCRSPRWAWVLAVLVGWSIAVQTLGASWYVNTNEGPRWWVLYQPAQMAAQVPWHAVVAAFAGLVAIVLIVGVVRSDRDAARPDEDAGSDLTAAPAGP